jgi:hypothetical protein
VHGSTLDGLRLIERTARREGRAYASGEGRVRVGVTALFPLFIEKIRRDLIIIAHRHIFGRSTGP